MKIFTTMLVGSALALGTLAAAPSAQADVRFNGASLNGIQFNGFKINGFKVNGLRINGIQFNGPLLQGTDPQGLVSDERNQPAATNLRITGVRLADGTELSVKAPR